MQMSSRQNRSIRYCWSPRHISMRWQNLYQHWRDQKEYELNYYKPDDPAQNAVLWMSASSIANCKYPWAESKEVNQTTTLTACRAPSICGDEKELQRVMAFRAQKSMHNQISADFLWTITTCDAYRLHKGQIMPCLSQVSKHLGTSVLCNCFVKVAPHKQGIFFHVYLSLKNLKLMSY